MNKREENEEIKVILPFSFKKKAFIIVLLLIVSASLVVASTFSWFAIATYPEISGINVTVGANGSLEIALLNNETGQDTNKIVSYVGNSIYVVGAVEGNSTWGNLIDLSDVDYGFNNVVMYPSLLSIKEDKINLKSPLSTPVIGSDGRVKEIENNTINAIYDGVVFSSKDAKFGAKAIGLLGGSGSLRETVLESAKNSFSASKNSAVFNVQNALLSNYLVLANIILNREMTRLAYEEMESVKSLLNGIRTSFTYIAECYKQAIICGIIANGNISDADFEAIYTNVNKASLKELLTYTSNFPAGVNAKEIQDLQNQIDEIDTLIIKTNKLLYKNYGTPDQEPYSEDTEYEFVQFKDMLVPIFNYESFQLDRIEGQNVRIDEESGEGLLVDIAKYVGNYRTNFGEASLAPTTFINDGKGYLGIVMLDDLVVSSETSETSSINYAVKTFYGLSLDFAFRTNVAADLQLQTEAIDRIYTDGAGKTMGSGSHVRYSMNMGVNVKQALALLEAVRIVFYDPVEGTIYGYARCVNPVQDDVYMICDIVLTNENGAVLESVKITDIEKMVVKRLSSIVYLDGSSINNDSVINAETAGSLLINLQFSSSADLIPLDNPDLRK